MCVCVSVRACVYVRVREKCIIITNRSFLCRIFEPINRISRELVLLKNQLPIGDELIDTYTIDNTL